jgi:lysophospholipase L1-like esterase
VGARVGGALRLLVACTALACLLGAAALTGAQDDAVAPAALRDPACGPSWAAAWHAAVQPARAAPDVAGRTLRMVVRPQVAGTQVRVRLSNAYGGTPMHVGTASVGRSDGAAGVVPGTLAQLSFAGRPDVVLAPGAEVLSDPAPVVAEPGSPLAVGLFLPVAPDVLTAHEVALETSYVSGAGDAALDPAGTAFGTPVGSWLVLSGLEVLAPRPVNAVVAVGDSITDGVGSPSGADQRWSDALSRRLARSGGGTAMAVLNAGISANQLVAGDAPVRGDAPLARFDRDVIASGATDVVLHIGTNDVAAGRAPGEIVAGLVAFAERARAAGTRLVLTTITPSRTGPHGTPAAVATREAVNTWVREHGPAHADAVADFAAAVADPADPARLAPQYDSGDGLHLSAAGYRALAAAVDPARLTGSPCLAGGPPARVLVSAP